MNYVKVLDKILERLEVGAWHCTEDLMDTGALRVGIQCCIDREENVTL